MQNLVEHIHAQHQGLEIKIENSIGGGCINQAFRVSSNLGDLFLKVNRSDLVFMFEAEYYGLLEMRDSKSIFAPEPLVYGKSETHAYLLMRYEPMNGLANWKAMGEQLAQMHRYSSDSFGWNRNNSIGTTQQLNNRSHRWVHFFREFRLGFQVDLARKNGLGLSHADELLSKLDSFFDDEPVPSLLHGDLWSGNVGFTMNGEPAFFDPATHYGDRECDLAMTEMFGGFSEEFYRAYEKFWPLEKGYQRRKGLYQLYHVLNHYNLFRGGYGSQSETLINKLIKQARL